MTFYLLGYLIIFYIAMLRFFTLRRDLPLTLFLYLFIGILGGIRFETGMDWPQYAEYFESISVEQDFLSAYHSNNYKLAFEFGYFSLNYIVKYLGGGLGSVFLIASVFCAISTYLLSSFFSGNRIFIFATYISYNFIYMHFSTVRQSIAVGLFFIGLWTYLKFSKKKTMCFFFALSACFQVSAILYICTFLASFLFRNSFKYITLWTVGTLSLFAAIHIGSNLYEIFALILPQPFSAKLLEYSTWNYKLSVKTYFFGLYIFGCALNLAWLEKKQNNNETGLPLSIKEKFAVNFAITSLMLTTALILLFPNNFALWTRTFNVASVLFACALSSFYYSNLKGYKLLFLLHMIIGTASFIASMYSAAEAMVPYKSFL